MKHLKTISLLFLAALLTVSLVGCKSKADENVPVDQVKAEADKMNVDQLKAKAKDSD